MGQGRKYREGTVFASIAEPTKNKGEPRSFNSFGIPLLTINSRTLYQLSYRGTLTFSITYQRASKLL